MLLVDFNPAIAIYGMTADGVCELLGFERICPRSREGMPRTVQAPAAGSARR
jgi:hypothetical protein